MGYQTTHWHRGGQEGRRPVCAYIFDDRAASLCSDALRVAFQSKILREENGLRQHTSSAWQEPRNVANEGRTPEKQPTTMQI